MCEEYASSRSGRRRRRRRCGHRRRRFWRRSATIFSFRSAACGRNAVPPFARCRAETAAFVCICKRVYL